MLIISSVGAAIGLMLVGVLLLGTWPAVWHALERAGRLPSHTFLDYSFTYMAAGPVVGLTLGQLGPSDAAHPPFLTQLHQSNGPLVAFALTGGVCLSLGDLAMQYATALLGLSVGPPLLNAVTIIISVVSSYFLDGGINSPALVFPGMAAATVAIMLGATAHVLASRASERRGASNGAGSSSGSGGGDGSDAKQLAAGAGRAPAADDSAHPACGRRRLAAGGGAAASAAQQQDWEQQGPFLSEHCSTGDSNNIKDAACGGGPGDAVRLQLWQDDDGSSSSTVKNGLNDQDQQQQQQQQRHMQRSIQPSSSPVAVGLVIAVGGGAVYGLFLPAFQIAANDPFTLLPPGVPPLTVYTTFFWFALGFAATSVAINTAFLYRPPLRTGASSVCGYCRNARGRGLSILSGLLAAGGDLTQFIGGQTAGYAACMLVMAYPVVGVLWGALRFKEFGGGASRTRLACVVLQVAAYLTAVGLLAASAQLRVDGGTVDGGGHG